MPTIRYTTPKSITARSHRLLTNASIWNARHLIPRPIDQVTRNQLPISCLSTDNFGWCAGDRPAISRLKGSGVMKQGRQIVYGIILLLVLTAQPGAVAQNFSYKTLFIFGDPDLSTGINPSGSLALGKDGRLYSTATCFSAFGTNYATVFGMNRDGTGFKVLHHFGDIAGDGSSPANGVIEWSDRALYGTTSGGGSLRYGTVFKVNKDGSGYQILWNFQGYANGDGANPQAGLIEASDGVLYGTTYLGGAGDGTVFRLNKDGTGYSIIKSLVRGAAAGAGPFGLIEGTDGALYGMSYSAGSGHSGTIFKLNKDGT